jgi:hypothetical protein
MERNQQIRIAKLRLLKTWALLCLISVLSAAGLRAKDIGHGSSLNRARNIHDGNLIRVTFHNFGMMGGQKGDQSQIYAGEWPIGSGLAQMGNASAYAMARLRIVAGVDETTGDTLYDYVTPAIFCEGWDPNLFSHDSLGVFQGFEPLPGFLNISQKEKDPMHAVAMSHMAYTWPPFWPDKLEDPFDPGWSGHWNGYFGKDQMNADQESYFVLDDYQYKKRVRGIRLPPPIPEEPDRGGLGLRMSVRGLQWSNPDAQDCIFWLYDIRNIGQLYLDQTLFGLNVGASSGALVTDNTDWDDDVARYYREKALAVNYDYDNIGTRGYSPVPWVGFAFLESPGNPYDGIDNDGDGINGAGKLITTDEFLKVYAPGDPIVLINYWSGRYERTVSRMPAEGVRFQVNGITYIKKPNAPLQEIPRNLIDDNLNGLIDESDGAVTQDSIPYYLYIRDPIYNNRDYLAKDYFTGAGLDNPLIDERRDDGIDNDGDWNPSYDDVGMDGKPGTGDTGEGDGLPTPGRGDLPGEPNVDLVDVDESDQIGLTSFKFYEYGDVTYSNDDQMWEISRPGYFDLGSRERADYDYVFASGYFPLMPNQKEFFSVAMLFGWDEREMLYNKEIVQKIYNSNYNFAVAPKKPVLRAVPGDRKVTLYWDSEAEFSFDRYLHQYDFEGYKIYRATAPTFEDAGSITDGYGYDRFKVPIAVFDKIDGIYGFFPLTFGTGVQFYLGSETGLTHTFVDSPLVNGMTYYYAVTAYDRGSLENNIGPSETTIFISVDQAGNVRAGENVAIVTPRPPSLGYVPPGFDLEPQPVGQLVTNGKVAVKFLEPEQLVDGDEYEIQFLDRSMDRRDNDLDGKIDGEDRDEWLPNETTGFVLRNLTRQTVFDTVWFYEYRMEGGSRVLIRNLYDDRDGDPRTLRAVLGGLEIFAYNPPGGVVHDPQRNIRNGIRWSQNIDYSTAYHLRFGLFDMKGFKPGIFYPRQYCIVFYDELVTRTQRIGVPLESTGKPIPVPETNVNYKIFDAATGQEVPFAAVDATVNRNLTPPGFFSAKDRIIFFERMPNDSVVVTFSLLNNDVQDTVFFKNYGRLLGAGDTLWLYPDFPFTGNVRYRFKVKGEKVDVQYARSHLDRIKVVPNPYVVTAVWEPLNPYTSGRGPRKVEFIHLPPRCTIRIYAVDGTLVKTIEHNSPLSDGSESWDLMSKDNMDLAYGVYIYHVDAPGIGQHVGRMLIIK